MADDDLQPLVDELAERLKRSVAIDDPSVRLLAASRHFGDEDPLRVTSVMNRSVPDEVTRAVLACGIATWARPGRVALDVAGMEKRLCVPVRCTGLLLGYLWLIESEAHPLTDGEIDMAVEMAARAGVVLYRRLLLRERSKARHESILRELVSSDETTRIQAVEDLSAEQLFVEQAMRYQVVAAHRGPTSTTEAAQDVAVEAAVEDGLRVVPDGAALMVANRSRAWLLLAQPEAPSERLLRAVSERITTRFRSLSGPETRLVVGIGDPVADLGLVGDSYRQAFLAARAALLVPSLGEVTRWGRLGPYDILLRLPASDVLRAATVPALAALEAGDHQNVLTETLEAFFDNAGDVRRAADLLRVHRGTLYHRLKRIEQLTGCDLDKGDDRLTLHLALKLRGLTAAYRAQSTAQPLTGLNP